MLRNQVNDIEEKIDSIDDFIFDNTMSLGAGSFASVRLGISKRTNKKYAIKTVKLILLFRFIRIHFDTLHNIL